MLKFYVKVFNVMGKALSGELSWPCDWSCFSFFFSSKPYVVNPHLNRLVKTFQMRGHNIWF